MGMKELIQNLRNKADQARAERDSLPDDVTRDKHLRSLRREKRVQMEKIEKQQLIKEIAEFKKQEMRKQFGIHNEDNFGKPRKLSNNKTLLKSGKEHTFLGKGRLL